MDAPSKIPMRLNVTGNVSPGGTLQAVLLIGHPMESGYRTLDSGQRIPKNVIISIRAQMGGQTLFEAETGIGISANPYLAFPVPLPAAIPATGLVLSVQWLDDAGQRGEIQRALK
ncbi:MAG: thiosulfate oxidation carrier complex protein SoxZ [Burkholderiaceae bacterium]